MGRDRTLPQPIIDLNVISIHSPRMGRDKKLPQPIIDLNIISIHSPRMGRDASYAPWCPTRGHFNPLSPHGERPAQRAARVGAGLFQSTLPAWGETDLDKVPRLEQVISIHSPRMGRDSTVSPISRTPFLLQSSLPAWGETP